MNKNYNIFIKEYKNGLSIKNICKKYKIGNAALKNQLVLNGVEIRGFSSTEKIISNDTIKCIIKDFNNGISIRKLEKIYNINRDKLSLILKLNSQDVVNRKHKLDENIFNKIDNEEKAYWLGFLYADGSVYKTRLEVGLKLEDEPHLIKLKEFLKLDKEIEYHTRKCKISTNPNKELNCCVLHITSKKLIDSLIKLGCTNKKSLTLTFPSEDIVPKYLIHHFVRGYFDGDGCISIDKSKTPSILFQVTGTFDMLSNIKQLYNIKANPRKIINIYDLRCKGNISAMNIFDILYKDATIYLDRKYEKYKQFKCRSR